MERKCSKAGNFSKSHETDLFAISRDYIMHNIFLIFSRSSRNRVSDVPTANKLYSLGGK